MSAEGKDTEKLEENLSDNKFSSMLSGILSNPSMMSMVSNIASQLKSNSQESAPLSEDTEADVSAPASEPSGVPETLGAFLPLLSGASSPSPQNRQREALLCALKPYLSSHRSDAIDTIIKIAKFSDIIKKL